MPRVLNVGTTMQELVQREILAEIRLIRKVCTKATLKVVELLYRRNTVDEEVD